MELRIGSCARAHTPSDRQLQMGVVCGARLTGASQRQRLRRPLRPMERRRRTGQGWHPREFARGLEGRAVNPGRSLPEQCDGGD